MKKFRVDHMRYWDKSYVYQASNRIYYMMLAKKARDHKRKEEFEELVERFGMTVVEAVEYDEYYDPRDDGEIYGYKHEISQWDRQWVDYVPLTADKTDVEYCGYKYDRYARQYGWYPPLDCTIHDRREWLRGMSRSNSWLVAQQQLKEQAEASFAQREMYMCSIEIRDRYGRILYEDSCGSIEADNESDAWDHFQHDYVPYNHLCEVIAEHVGKDELDCGQIGPR